METNIIPQTDKNIGVLFSGGTDSTLLLYQLSKTHPESKLYLWSGSRLDDKQFNLKNINDILLKLKLNNIGAHNIVTFKDREDGKQKRAKLHKQFVEMFNLDCMVNGFTLNPPEDLGEGRDEKRDVVRSNKSEQNGITYYMPFVGLTKKDIAKQYEENGIRDSLFPLTVSCEAVEPPRPCKKCWWCKERYWGFGEY